ncbi:MAG: hypothetical protein ABI221_01635 [Candidatus Saccharimonadales bacterium]
MKLIVLYHPHSESARIIEEYVADIQSRRPVKADLVSLETREGADLASLYDIVRYPAILVTDDVGHPVKDWQGDQLPLRDEVLGYVDS